MNANTTAVEYLFLYRLLGEEAFVALISLSDVSEERLMEITDQVQNWAPMPDDYAAQIRAAVAQRGRLGVKNDLINVGISDANIELAFRAAGV